MNESFDDKISRIQERYVEKRVSKTEQLIESIFSMDNSPSFFDKMKARNQAAQNQKGVVSNIGKAAVDKAVGFAREKLDLLDPKVAKWYKDVEKQWEGMMPQMQAVYSNPPAKPEKHNDYGAYEQKFNKKRSPLPGPSLEEYVGNEIVLKVLKSNAKFEEADIDALGGFNRFLAKQWNRTITGQTTDGGPGSQAWEDRIRQMWDKMDPKPVASFDDYRKIKEDEYNAMYNT